MNCAVNSPTPGIMPIITPKLDATVATRRYSHNSFSPEKIDPFSDTMSGLSSFCTSSRNAWLSANRPSTTTIRSTPDASQLCSKVKRRV